MSPTVTSADPPEADQFEAPTRVPVVVIEDFAEFFRFHYPRVVRALTLAGAGQRAEDIAQESFARTLGHWRRVRGGTNPPGYVFRTAFRLLRRRGLLPTSPLDDNVGAVVSGVDDTASAKVDVDRAVACMPPRRRACVVMCWLLDASTAEAAETLGIATGTVRKQLELARRQLSGDLTP
ncbi:MAG: RNA polymerase sigma factor [Acidimicrobiales bacterium]